MYSCLLYTKKYKIQRFFSLLEQVRSNLTERHLLKKSIAMPENGLPFISQIQDLKTYRLVD